MMVILMEKETRACYLKFKPVGFAFAPYQKPV